MSRRIDRTGFGDLVLVQDPELFCYGIDAVLLAAFAADPEVRNRPPEHILDLGCGNGIVPLILSHKTDAADIRGIERQERCVSLAEETRERNGLEDRLRFYNADIADGPDACGIERCFFDTVTANPPYVARGSGIRCESEAKDLARRESSAGIREFFSFAEQVLLPGGDFYVIYRPDRLVDLCEAGREFHLEPKEMRLISGREGARPNLLLSHLVKNGGHGLRVLEPMYVREADGSYSEDVLRIYERGREEDRTGSIRVPR
ncbi:MAG: tRNA1(Val) (adenine(37)-N6)-methyltransferase [Anaerovoracaceae bacterium]|jgi:tRNA1Val (adenine37-N6)-methyltransferase